jgi:uncharacterized protein YqhQ
VATTELWNIATAAKAANKTMLSFLAIASFVFSEFGLKLAPVFLILFLLCSFKGE